MSIFGTNADSVVELMMNFMNSFVEPWSVESSVTPVEHQIFTENHEQDLKQIHRSRIKSKNRNFRGLTKMVNQPCCT